MYRAARSYGVFSLHKALQLYRTARLHAVFGLCRAAVSYKGYKFSGLSLWDRVERWLTRLATERSVRFKSFGWLVAILFISFSILSQLNPFYLLIPNHIIPFPIWDIREKYSFYGITGEEERLLSIKRPYRFSADPEVRMRQIAYVIATPPGIQEERSAESSYLRSLPHFGTAIGKVWLFQSDLLIIDLNGSALEKEWQLFSQRTVWQNSEQVSAAASAKIFGEEADLDREGGRFLDLFFGAFIASVFAIETDVDAILFLVDGQKRAIPAMQVDLSKRYSRLSFGGELQVKGIF